MLTRIKLSLKYTLLKYIFFLFVLIQVSCSDKIIHPQAPSDSFDIILVIGQSNTLAGTGMDPKGRQHHIKQLGRFNGNDLKVIEAIEPLDHHSKRQNCIGFALTFARLYEKEILSVDRNLLIIPGGKGGTSFKGRFWNKGGPLYEDALMRVKYCLDNFPNSKLVAILWHQGESDIDNPRYQANLDSMIQNIRKDIGNLEAPLVLGGMVPYWVRQDQKHQKIQSIIQDTPNRIIQTAYADPMSPFVISKPNDKIDEIHYNADGQRELGKRYYESFKRLVKK